MVSVSFTYMFYLYQNKNPPFCPGTFGLLLLCIPQRWLILCGQAYWLALCCLTLYGRTALLPGIVLPDIVWPHCTTAWHCAASHCAQDITLFDLLAGTPVNVPYKCVTNRIKV